MWADGVYLTLALCAAGDLLSPKQHLHRLKKDLRIVKELISIDPTVVAIRMYVITQRTTLVKNAPAHH